MKPLLPAVFFLTVLFSMEASAELMPINSLDDGKTGMRDPYGTFVWRINFSGRTVSSALGIAAAAQDPDDVHSWKRASKILHLEKRDMKKPASSARDIDAGSVFHYASVLFSLPENTTGRHTGFAPSIPAGGINVGQAISAGGETLMDRIAGNLPNGYGFGGVFTSGSAGETLARTEAVPEPSIWKLFVLSLLWIPFNRWERKKRPADSASKNTTEY